MDKDVLEKFVKRLRVMESGSVNTLDNFNIESGICDNLDLNVTDSDRSQFITEMFGMFRTWEGFSGSSIYPIGDNPQDGRSKFHILDVTKGVSRSKWLDNDYCNSRRRLAGHLANGFEKLLTAQRG